MAGAKLARRAMAGNFLAQHTVAAVQSKKLSESYVDQAKAERRRSPGQACVRGGAAALGRSGLRELASASWPCEKNHAPRSCP